MAENKVQFSQYEMGEFKENKWYCGCDDPARRFTSNTDQTGGDTYPLTPVSRHDILGRRQPFNVQSSPTSPTPKRRLGHVEVPDQPLLAEILELLKSANIEMKASTDSQLRHLVNMGVAGYETKIRTCEATINELRNKLVEMES
ncbi:GRF zinc finger domain-containing protein [Penicillium cf. griseofulvum]|uniref:GRF zinc finger domain-containing protein n=1 Tax=Penicillium cf. griseofulvum TaxID=2972120 RepID=A0A9W9MYX8_9EURO|nr:GRF zinc finger domain-containing protein [Penicillium cf. griseofulvum]KAJ5421343.1 GRF zinc finger domain-containing protein [Penicillium cf. griseofulvum]KAJ5424578.1 GRF zinc finger domain-containing protein [Penicillium cf. griseofulvum]